MPQSACRRYRLSGNFLCFIADYLDAQLNTHVLQCMCVCALFALVVACTLYGKSQSNPTSPTVLCVCVCVRGLRNCYYSDYRVILISYLLVFEGRESKIWNIEKLCYFVKGTQMLKILIRLYQKCLIHILCYCCIVWYSRYNELYLI